MKVDVSQLGPAIAVEITENGHWQFGKPPAKEPGRCIVTSRAYKLAVAAYNRATGTEDGYLLVPEALCLALGLSLEDTERGTACAAIGIWSDTTPTAEVLARLMALGSVATPTSQ